MATEEVHLLIGYETYYPGPDNTIRVFNDKKEAEDALADLQSIRGSGFKERYNELREVYEWLPKYSRERYEVVTHPVE